MWFNDAIGYPGAQQPRPFENQYTCWPTIMLKEGCESGDKLILPQSALDALGFNLTSGAGDSPWMFELTHEFEGQVFKTHCGVREFSAPEGKCYVPYWIMNNLQIEPGRIITLKKKNLPKGSYVKLRPSTSDFLEITNPKAVLEIELRKFTCLTLHDTICIQYNDKNYYIDIRELKPTTEDCSGVCIIDTDCFTDFEEPEDYRKQNPVKPPQPPKADSEAVVFNKGAGDVSPAIKGAEETTDESNKEEEEKFKAFVGRGRRLDDKGGSKTSSLSESSSNSKGSSVSDSTPSKSSFQRGGARANKFSKKKSLVAFDGKPNKF